MKLKALLLALFVAGLTASFALADPGHDHGRGKPEGKDAGPLAASATSDSKAPKCRPSIELELAGTVASAPSGGSMALLVTKGGGQGQSLAGKQVTLDVSQANVHGTPTSGQPVRVHARACVDLVALTVKLVADQVQAGGNGGDHEGSSSSSTTSTTTATTT